MRLQHLHALTSAKASVDQSHSCQSSSAQIRARRIIHLLQQRLERRLVVSIQPDGMKQARPINIPSASRPAPLSKLQELHGDGEEGD